MATKRKMALKVGIAGQGRSGYCIHADWLKQTGDTFTIAVLEKAHRHNPLPRRVATWP